MTVAAVKDFEPEDRSAEQHLLGSLLTIGKLGPVVAETRLAPEQFALSRHADIYRAMLALRDRQVPCDLITVADELKRRGNLDEVGGKAYLSELELASSGRELQAISYAEIVAEKARWRGRMQAGQAIREASLAEDEEAYTRAAETLAEGIAPPDSYYGEDRQRDLIFELMQGKAQAEFSWPIPKLNTLQSGGMRRGQMIVLAAATNEGKSNFAAQILDHNRSLGRRVCLYDNEMGVDEQAARRVTRQTGVPFGALMDGKLTDGQTQKVMEFLNGGSLWPIVDCAGWSATEICHHIRHYRWDFVVFDILHNLIYSDERELAAAVAQLKATAKIANCCIVVVAHVSRAGVERGRRRRPVRSDLKWSGDIENLADAVCFLFRKQDETTLEPTPEGYVYFDKCRGGRLGAEYVRFNAMSLEWELRAPDGDAE